MNPFVFFKICILLAMAVFHSAAALAQVPVAGSDGSPLARLRASVHRPTIDHTLLLGVARAGDRIVAVGEHGAVVLSDDAGKTFRHAKKVPVQATLTAVHFADAQKGWAVGHWGIILVTQDGGENWTLQHVDTAQDQPLFAVHFSDAQNGLAVGLWSMMMRTTDGGATWQQVAVPPRAQERKADRNLFSIFSDKKGVIYVTSESGQVLVSPDTGKSWRYLDTGYEGSLWCGIALPDGGLLVAGLRGTLLRSDDSGATWTPIAISAARSITSLASDEQGGVVGVGLEGLYLSSRDARTFETHVLEGRPILTGVVKTSSGKAVLISKMGPVRASDVPAPSTR